jgi:hypothetical protein
VRLLALLLALLALLLPEGWYDALPPRLADVPPPPIRGTTLLRALLGAQAAALLAASWRDWRWTTLPANARLHAFAPRAEPDDLDATRSGWWLAAITTLGLALRVHGIDTELWIDELLTLDHYAREPLAVIVGSYRTSNNHLLVSLLMKASVAAFGDAEWSVRLAAVGFGVATIPALYRVARLAASRRASLGAALLLAVSYHHIDLSQSARGYGAHLCLALLATRAFVDGLHADRLRHWATYAAATVLGFTALLTTMFVVAAQGVLAILAVLLVRRAGGDAGALARRLAVVFAVTGALCLDAYAVALPEAYMMLTTAYAKPFTGVSVTWSALLAEVTRSVSDGIGTGGILAAVPFLALAAAGLVALWRRHWGVTLALALPGVLLLVLLAARGMTVTLRQFLLWLPLAIVTAVVAIDVLARRLARRRASGRRVAFAGAVGLLAMVFLAALPRYYAVPKQPWRAALAWLEARRGPDDLVIALHAAAPGVRHYAADLGPDASPHYVTASDTTEFDTLLATRGTRPVRLVTTVEQVLALQHPRLLARVLDRFQRDTTFAATLRCGEVTLWSERIGGDAPP